VGAKKAKTSKKQTDHSKGLPSASASGRQETLVPNLVYNMAQLDAKVVALSEKHKIVDFTKALPRNVQRDFRFDEDVISRERN
jgi:hypothetical protein